MTRRLTAHIRCIALLLLCMSPSALAADELDLKKYAEEAKQWEDDIARFEAINERESYPADSIMFVGSSSIRLWESISEDLEPFHPIQRGFGGAKISDVLVLLPRLIGESRFRAIVFFVGGNDVWGQDEDKSPEEIKACADALIKLVRFSRPDVPVFFIEITPSPRRAELDAKEARLNAALQKSCEEANGVYFIATRTAFLDEAGKRTPRWFAEDQLHLNAEGYKLWAGLIKARLDEVLVE